MFNIKAANRDLARIDKQIKQARQGKKNQQHQQQGSDALLDDIDRSAIAEGNAKAQHRVSMPAIMGRKIMGARRNDRKTVVASSHNQNAYRERKLGDDDYLKLDKPLVLISR
jgi:hypothetical protein